MRCIAARPTGSPVLIAGAAFLVMLVGCSGPSQVTSVKFDGETYSIDGPVSCVRQPDRTLVINAPVARKWGGGTSEGGKKLIRVVLVEESRLVVESVGVRLDDVRGFSDTSDEMWATKADNTYTINGRMAPEDGAAESHQFKIEVTCSSIEREVVPLNPPPVRG